MSNIIRFKRGRLITVFMTLYLIGIGLWDEKDISVKGLETAKSCEKVYLEKYTSVLFGTSKEKIEKLLGKELVLLDRKAMEQDKPYMLEAKDKEIAVLVGGDPLSATTHMETLLEAKDKGITTSVIHAASVLVSVAESGLYMYKFGKTCSVPFWSEGYEPISFYDVILENKGIGAHTLVLLDLKPEEERFMTVNQALELLLKAANEKGGDLNEETYVVGIARMGSEDQLIKFGTIAELMKTDFGGPMHILVVPGDLNPIEAENLSKL